MILKLYKRINLKKGNKKSIIDFQIHNLKISNYPKPAPVVFDLNKFKICF